MPYQFTMAATFGTEDSLFYAWAARHDAVGDGLAAGALKGGVYLAHTRHPERSTLDTLAHSVSVDTLRGFAQQWCDRHIGPEQAG